MNNIRRHAATSMVAGVIAMGLATQAAPAMATTHAAGHVVTATGKPVTRKPVPKRNVTKKPVIKKPVPKKPAPVKLTAAQATALAQQILTDRLDRAAVVTGTTIAAHRVQLATATADASQGANTGVSWTTRGAVDDTTPYTTCDTVPEIGCSHTAFGTGTLYELGNGLGHQLYYVRGDHTVISFWEFNQEEMGDFLPVDYSTAGTLLNDARWAKVVTSLPAVKA